MNVFQPWQLLLVTLAGWINRQQQDVIAYIQEENRILKNKLKGKRIRFTNDERRRLAVKGKVAHRPLGLPGTVGKFPSVQATQSGDGSNKVAHRRALDMRPGHPWRRSLLVDR